MGRDETAPEQDQAPAGPDGTGGTAPYQQQDPLRVADAFQARSRDSLVSRMGIQLIEATAQRVVGTMPVAGNT